jgi:hypothetical protein
LIEVEFNGLIIVVILVYLFFVLLDRQLHSGCSHTYLLLNRRFLFLFAFLFRIYARFPVFPHRSSRSSRTDGSLRTILPSSVDLVRPVQSSFDQCRVGKY